MFIHQEEHDEDEIDDDEEEVFGSEQEKVPARTLFGSLSDWVLNKNQK